MLKVSKILTILSLISICSSCNTITHNSKTKPDFTSPKINTTPLIEELKSVPKLDGPEIYIGVGKFRDLTGKRSTSDNYATFSSAVTQGAEAYLMESLMATGWFKVLERAEQESVLRERSLVNQTRQSFDQEPVALPPQKYAGVLAFGGILDYDVNNITGGAGAAYLGIGLTDEYRQDTVTIALRIVSTMTGEVLLATTSSKTIISTKISGTLFKFFDMDTLPAEAEIGYAKNELVSTCVRAALDKAVIDIIHKGKEEEYWKFKESK